MCDTQITPQVQNIDKLPLGARVFINGKNRPLHVVETPDEIYVQLIDAAPDAVRLTNLNGEDTIVPKSRIVSVVAPTPNTRRKVNPPAEILWGKQFAFRGLAAYNTAQANAESPFDVVSVPEGESEHDYIAVVAQDLAEALVLVVNIETGHALWINPAVPERAIRRLAKAARLVAEAESLTLVANAVEGFVPSQPGLGDVGPAL